MKPQYVYLDDIRYGKSTIKATIDDIAGSVNLGLMNFYDALIMSKAVTDNFRGENFFASPRRAALKLLEMITKIDSLVVPSETSPATAQRIPATLLDPDCFSLQEITLLLGQILDPVAPDMPMGRAVVTTFDMPFAGNFRIGIHWGRQFDAPAFITKSQLTNFRIRELAVTQQ